MLLGTLSRCCPDVYPNGTLIRGKYTHTVTIEYRRGISLILASNISLFEGEEFMPTWEKLSFCASIFTPPHIVFTYLRPSLGLEFKGLYGLHVER